MAKHSVGSTVFDLNQLFSNHGMSAKGVLQGQFKQDIISTRDYTITLVTNINHVENDVLLNGTEYHLQLNTSDEIRVFHDLDELLQYVDTYVMTHHNVMLVEFSLDNIPREQYDIEDPSMNVLGRKVKFKELGVNVIQIKSFDEPRISGYIKAESIDKLAPIWSLIEAKIL